MLKFAISSENRLGEETLDNQFLNIIFKSIAFISMEKGYFYFIILLLV